jgi:hypothetical protein
MDSGGILLPLVLSNFSLAMFVVALFFILLHKLFMRSMPLAEIAYRWTVFFALGCTSLYAFVMHAFYPDVAAATIGWMVSPFQFEVAMANLAFGVLGVLAFNASYGFRLATALGAACLWWGAADGHLYQLFTEHNFSVGNAGSWLWMDLLIPLILLTCIIKLKPAVKR